MNAARVYTPQDLEALAQAAYARGEYLRAAEGFEAAAAAFEAAGEPLRRAEMANNHSVALLQAGSPQAALQVVRDTPQEFEASGDTRLYAMALGNRAAALDALGRFPEAEQDYLLAADLLQSIGETDLRAALLQALSRLQLRSGRQWEALASMQAGLEGIERPSLKQRLAKRLIRKPFDLLKR